MYLLQPALSVVLVQGLALLSAIWLSGNRRLLDRGLEYLVSMAVGVLLSTSLLHILPEGVSALGNRLGLWLTFAGTIVVMYSLERLASCGHTHTHANAPAMPLERGHRQHAQTRPATILLGGALHSFVDGVSIAAAFAVGERVGWLTALAIAMHEVPHRMGVFALLTHLHVARRRALRMLLIVSAAALAGVASVGLIGRAFTATTWLLPVSAGSFVYIAMVDLMPELAKDAPLTEICRQLLCMLLGAGGAALMLRLPNA